MTISAVLVRGFLRETLVPVTLTVLEGGGYATAPCPECEGSGWWAYAEPEVPGAPCVDCKGRGRVYIAL